MTLMQIPFLTKRNTANRAIDTKGRGTVAAQKSPPKVEAAQKGRNTIRKRRWIGFGAIE